jgi:hypothetical protein
MLSEQNIADPAVLIRQALLPADKSFTDDVVAVANKLEDVDHLVPTAFLDVPGFNYVQTRKLDLSCAGWTGGLC